MNSVPGSYSHISADQDLLDFLQDPVRLEFMAGLDSDSLLALISAGDCSAISVMDESSPCLTPFPNSTATSPGP